MVSLVPSLQQSGSSDSGSPEHGNTRGGGGDSLKAHMHQVGLHCTAPSLLYPPFPLLSAHPPTSPLAFSLSHPSPHTPPLAPHPSHHYPSHHSLPYSLDPLHCIVSCLAVSHTQVSQAVQEGDKDTDYGDRIRECKDPQNTVVWVHSHVLHV